MAAPKEHIYNSQSAAVSTRFIKAFTDENLVGTRERAWAIAELSLANRPLFLPQQWSIPLICSSFSPELGGQSWVAAERRCWCDR